jgi:hypothetical protein
MMESEDKISQLEQLMADITAYINLRFDALKLRAVDHLSSCSGMLFSAITGMLLFVLALLFLLAGCTYWLAQILHSPAGAMFITGGFVLCITVLVILLRKKIFTNRMVRFFIRMFFNPTPPGSHRENKENDDEA